MRVLLWGTYDTSKPRIRILRSGLGQAGVDLHEIHASVWERVQDKSQVHGWGARAWLLLRWVFAYPKLIFTLIRAPKPDLILVGYPGIFDAFIASAIGYMRGIPVVWDVFLSLYDTIVEDRRLWREKSLAARMLYAVERSALRRVALAFMDTQAHARRIEKLFQLPSRQCGAVWVGVETEHFVRTPPAQEAASAKFRVLFYGQFIPLHGIDTIVDAARLMRDEPVEWVLIGKGQEAARIRDKLNADPLPRVEWIDWVEYETLQDWLARADLCLGIFGTSEKAASVIPNKVFQIVAAGRPLLTRDSPAIRELLTADGHCTHLVSAGDAKALADAVRQHRANWLLQQTPIACHSSQRHDIDAAAIARQFIAMVQERLGIHE